MVLVLTNKKFILEKLGDYLVNSKSSLIPNGYSFQCVTQIEKISKRNIGNKVYFFSVILKTEKGLTEKRNLILKIYSKSLDPVNRKYIIDECEKRCLREFEILKDLYNVNFPVPRVFLMETNRKFFGNPSIIMQREAIDQKSSLNIASIARQLAILHSLDVKKLEISNTAIPKSAYDFPQRCLLYLKLYMNLYPKHREGLAKDFLSTIQYLESKVSDNSHYRCCLLHGDYRLGLNILRTTDGRMLVTDWEDATVGDPAYDVGVAYVRTESDFGRETADRFLKEYLTYSEKDISKRIAFYKLLAYLRLAITHSSILSNPRRKLEIRGPRALIFDPFNHLTFLNRKAGNNLDYMWVDKFKKEINLQKINLGMFQSETRQSSRVSYKESGC